MAFSFFSIQEVSVASDLDKLTSIIRNAEVLVRLRNDRCEDTDFQLWNNSAACKTISQVMCDERYLHTLFSGQQEEQSHEWCLRKRVFFVQFLIPLHRRQCMRQTTQILQCFRIRILSQMPHLRRRKNILAISEAYPQLHQSLRSLDHESLDLVLEGADLAHEVGGLVGGDAAADNCAADTAGAAKSHLAGDVNLRMAVSTNYPCNFTFSCDSRRECSCPRREAAGGEGWPEGRCRRPG